MTQALERPNINNTAPTPETLLPTSKEGLFLEETSPQDPELLAFTKENQFQIGQGNINIDFIEGLKPPAAWAYKMHFQDEESDTPELAGAVYAITRGMDYGNVQIAYFVGSQYQKKGITTAAVATVTELLSGQYNVMASIDDGNEFSKKIVQSLGYAALGFDGRKTNYFKLRERPKPGAN